MTKPLTLEQIAEARVRAPLATDREAIGRQRIERELYNADPACEHDIKELQSGVKCKKCPGWFCF